MQSAAPSAEGPPLQHRALHPAQAEGDFGEPILDPCTFETMVLADDGRNDPEPCQVLKASISGSTFLLMRDVKDTMYGSDWVGVQISIDGDRFARHFDERGVERLVSIKKMPWAKITELEERGDVMENGLREIPVLALLSKPGHPNVLRKLEALFHDDFVFLVTPFIDGGDGTDIVAGEEFDWMAKMGGSREDAIRNVFRQILEALMYMHSKGVCHAYMSPENVLIDRDGRPYITDCSMSLLMPTTEDGRRCMSVRDCRIPKDWYCSPEVFKNNDYDGVKIDVFAAGAMLFMMLKGFAPFESATRADPAFKKLVWEGDVQGLLQSYDEDELSTDAAGLICSLMAYEPEDRPTPEEALAHQWFNPPPPPEVSEAAEATVA